MVEILLKLVIMRINNMNVLINSSLLVHVAYFKI